MSTRLIGSVDVDDRVNTWYDYATESFAAHNTYEQQVNNGGTLIRTRQDKVAVVVTLQGVFLETAAKRWSAFADSLLAVNQGALDFGNGIAYAKADVIDLIPTPIGIVGDASGVKLRAYRYSARIQTYSGSRV